MLGRAHTIAAVALMAFAPLMPLGLWLYARAASVDRGVSVSRNERLFHSMRHVRGATLFAEHSYAQYRWGSEGSLVPVERYRTEFFLNLPRALRPDAIVTHYVRTMRGWHAEVRAVDCRQLGLRDGCGAARVLLTRGGVKVDVDVAESMRRPQHATGYAVYVSQ